MKSCRKIKKLLFLLVACVALLSVCSCQSAKALPVKLDFTLLFENVDESLSKKIMVGNLATESGSRLFMGTVEQVDNTEPYHEYQIDGEIKKIEYKNRRNVRIRITSNGEFIEGVGCSVNGIRIAVGKRFELRFPDYVGVAYCTDLKWEIINED